MPVSGSYSFASITVYPSTWLYHLEGYRSSQMFLTCGKLDGYINSGRWIKPAERKRTYFSPNPKCSYKSPVDIGIR